MESAQGSMSSWVRSALSRTAEAASTSSRTIEAGFQRAGVFAGTLGSMAGSALIKAGDAVEKGAKIVLEHAETAVVGHRYNDFRHAVRRMDETSLSFGEEGGEDRKEAMRRWLWGLEELETRRLAQVAEPAAADATSDTSTANPGKSSSPEKVKAGSTERDMGASKLDDRSLEDQTHEKTEAAVTGESQQDAAESQLKNDAADPSEIAENTEGSSPSAAAEEKMVEFPSYSRSESQGGTPLPDPGVIFFDGSPSSSEPLSFRDVFLESKALEHIVSSLIADSADNEEWGMLGRLFGLTLAASKEEAEKLVGEIRKLASSFSSYCEAKMSGDELLIMVSDTVSSLKSSPDLERLRKRSAQLLQQLNKKAEMFKDSPSSKTTPSANGASSTQDTDSVNDEGTKSLLAMGAQWLELQRKQQTIMQRGDTPGDRLLKIQRITAMVKSLEESAALATESITECKKQREEALSYRTKRAEENRSAEKVALTAMEALQTKKADLQRQLEEVEASITVVSKQLQKLNEEKEHFYKASSETVAAFASQGLEKEQQSAVFKGDAEVLKEWHSFLELSWPMEQTCMERKQGKLNEDSGESMPCIWPLAKAQLQLCKDNVIQRTGELREQVSSLEQTRAIRDEFEKKETKEGESIDGGAEALAVMQKLAEQEENYLLVECKSKAASGEALQSLSEIQSWLSWAKHYSAGKEKQVVEVKQLMEELEVVLGALHGISRPPLSKNDPYTGSVGVFARPQDGKSWKIESIGSVLQGGIVVAPVGASVTVKDGTPASVPQKPIPAHLKVVEGDHHDQLPTPPVISGKRKEQWEG